MQPTSFARHLPRAGGVAIAAATVLVLAAPPPVAAAVAASRPVPAPAAVAAIAAPPPMRAPATALAAAPVTALHTVADLAARRLATADLVAAAKYGTGAPIDDPVRERQVLDAVARQARDIGADPQETVRVFRDQIEANKLVQRALFHQWDTHPAEAPTERPDLTRVREEINRVNAALVHALADSAPSRHAPSCDGRLVAAAAHVRHERALDSLHATALARSLPSVCASNS